MMSLTKNLKPKTINFFSLPTTRLAESFEHLNSSLVTGLQSYACTKLCGCFAQSYVLFSLESLELT